MSTIEKAMDKFGDGADKAPASNEAEPSHDPKAQPQAQAAAAKVNVTSPGDGQEGTRARVALDWTHLKAMGIVDPRSEHNSQVSEQLRNIKRPLLMHVNGQAASVVKHPNLIMVTSSLPGEGKTFTSINLAMSLAMEMEKSVLLIDADVAKPEVSNRLGVQAKAGFTDVLSDPTVELKDVLIRTDLPNLQLLPAGRKHVHSTELLASGAMRDLAAELATRYADRIIVFDSPPLLMTSEARVLASLMGQIVVVVEESRTTQPVIKEALGLLQSCEVIGLVLNKSKRPGGADYYGGYGYGYGYGYGQ